MIFSILGFVLSVLLAAIVVIDIMKQNKVIDRITRLAMKVAELEDAIQRVDQSTGTEMNRIGTELKKLDKELKDFRELYGDAAVEAFRAEAEAQRAFAKGIANIMSFDGTPQNEGE